MFFLYTHLYIEHVCNSGTILGNLGGGWKGKKNDSQQCQNTLHL
jgi:hypothetical protein